jgi:hypothetical protein
MLVPLAFAGRGTAATACGSFTVPGATIHVIVKKGHVSCSSARRVITDFWRGRGNYHQRNPNNRSYTSVDGWRCPNIRIGSSECSKGRNVISGTYPVGKGATV